MSASDSMHERSLTPIGIMVARSVASALGVWDRKHEDRLCEDLERIALSAPHLLIDVGFVRDTKASSPVETIFSKGSLRVAISSRDGSVAVWQQ